MTTTRSQTTIARKAAARIDVLQWDGTVAPLAVPPIVAPPEFFGVAALLTAFGTLFVTVYDEDGLPVPNALVEITFSKPTADIVEDASAVAGNTNTRGIVVGYGTTAAVGAGSPAGYFSGMVASGTPNAAIGACASLSHLITANAYGQVALKVATQPTTLDATVISIRSGSAMVTVANDL